MATVNFRIDATFSDDCDEQTIQRTEDMLRQIKNKMVDALHDNGIEVEVTGNLNDEEESERSDQDALSRGGVFL